MRKATILSSVLVLSMLLSSCALLFKGETDTVDVTSDPIGAEVFIDGVSYGTTPLNLELRSDETYEVMLRLDGEERTVILRNEIGTLWIVLDIVGGLVPLIVDAATGAWYELEPDQVFVEFN